MGLQENIQRDAVTRLEIRDAVTVRPSTSVRDTVSMMRESNIGCSIVVDDNQKPVGVFTESMLTEQLSHGGIAWDEPIEKHSAPRCPWVRSTDPISEVLEAMQIKNVRMLCVVDDQNRVVGVTGQRGVMEYVAEHFPDQVMVQRVGQSPYLSNREGA